jgi:hypothetical protein
MKTRIEIKGEGFVLQHPGNREWLKLQKEMLNVGSGQLDMEKLLDYSFEHVVFPEKGAKLSLDTIDLATLEVWQGILPRFLRGRLSSGDTGSGFVIADKAPDVPAEGVEKPAK